MLVAITGEHLYWQCLIYDEDGDLLSCGEEKTAPISEVHYQETEVGTARGAVIALPQCRCGAQMFLKADYSLKELCKATHPVQNEQGVLWAYVLPLRYVYNLRAWHLLYERGQAPHAPVLPMPGQALLGHPRFAGVPPDVVYAFWFGMLSVRERTREIGSKMDGLLLHEPELLLLGG